MKLFKRLFKTHSEREIKRIQPMVNKVLSLEEPYSKLSDKELQAKTQEFKKRLSEGETLDSILPEAFATIREASWRVLGMKHYPVQVIGGIVLHQGRIAEMRTGEGKTLVATLPVYLNALTGNGVHVVTVNDYLATRDSEWMGKVYKWLGLTVGLIVHDLSRKQRQDAYSCDIVYGTNNEFGFDYLRDNMVTYKSSMVQRTLEFAIVDEVDSILIDEARTPLIISGQGDESTDMYVQADRFVKTLKAFEVKEMDNKEDMDALAGDADYIVDLKAKSAVFTQQGVKKAEKAFGLDNLADEKNYDIQHYLNNALKAHGTMHLDQAYVVKDGEIIIVDDFTGRLMQGRRYSDGLHQAIEAKEGVKVNRESKTLATITFQNYFRMYHKLSGMTGTALTEEREFRDIYNLDVITIPTNKPMIRKDLPDCVYKTEKVKYEAIVEDVKSVHATGQPILIGTISVEKSEKLSKYFKKAGIPHNVLNAKQHEREAEIVAQAGRTGSVTIATNMAGRGTDILLGGNPEYMARLEMRKDGYIEEVIEQATAHNDTTDEVVLEAREVFAKYYDRFKVETEKEHNEVVALGGLYIIGTERHESRRIDNQLRGRSGRQGDPGQSRFYLALEDELMRLFGGDRVASLFDSWNVDEDQQIEAGFLTRVIESAQKKVEGRNYGTRKHVLEYDDVMNQQRELIYAQRQRVLEGEDLHSSYQTMVKVLATNMVHNFLHSENGEEKMNYAGLRNKIAYTFGSLPILDDLVGEEAQSFTFEQLLKEVPHEAVEALDAKEESCGPELLREAERVVLLKVVDDHWMNHIDAMDDLRDSIGMRGYAQQDPVREYKREGSQMFDEMNDSIREDAVRLIMRSIIQENRPMEREEANLQKIRERKDDVNGFEEPDSDASNVEPVQRPSDKVGRNDPCTCGSGKKYKNCCGKH